MLRLVGVNIPDDMDIFTGMKMIKGLDSKHSDGRVERILTKAGLYFKKKNPNGTVSKVYTKVGDMTWKQKARLLELIDMPRASLGSIRMSPRKLRLVADTIRGKHVDEALGILAFLDKGGTGEMHKLLKSAIANASNNHELKADKLYVSKVLIDGGPTMRRFMARARGRACRIRKRTASALIVLQEKFEMTKAMKKAAGESKSATPAATAEKPVAKKAKAPATRKKATKTAEGEK